MTENIPQTSASERQEAARIALTSFEGATPDRGFDDNDRYKLAKIMADALRSLITPPGLPLTVESEAVNDAVNRYDWPFHERIEISSTELADLGTHLFRAGIQSAHESWEPADVPSQEFMLRHLGIEYEDARDDEADPDTIRIRTQFIAKEVF